ncbi:MAG: SAM-dependent methyltransferase [Rhizobiaceae bacterium]|nr:SAM-dependent methyltransferase [Rhizobiaceae bacterium]
MIIQSVGDAEASLPARRANPYEDQQSIEFRFRERRFAQVRSLIEAVIAEKGSCEILDLGGTEYYWRIGAGFLAANRDKVRITIVNLEVETIADSGLFRFIEGSATDQNLLAGSSFDLVHSNSVIEHVGEVSDMKLFAQNVRRLAPRYYVQTPNYWFAYEPHFRLLGFQYLPQWARVAIIRNFAVGFFAKVPDRAEAEAIIRHHHLVTTRQMRDFFPDARIVHEKVAGLNKSIIALRG